MKLAALVATLCLAVIAAPLSRFPWLYFVFSFVCHQQPERSLWLAGLPLAVCARCAGIYLGGLLGLLLDLPSRRAPLVTALGLLFLDWAGEAMGVRPPWMPLRLLTGALAGLAAAPVVLEAGTALSRPPYTLMYRPLGGNQP